MPIRAQATPAYATKVLGTTTNDDAAAGYVGEYVQSVVTSGAGVTLTTATPANITSLSLTAGDWDVRGTVISNSSVGSTSVQGSISTTSATHAASPFSAKAVASSSVDPAVAISEVRVSLSATTTVYLVMTSVFGSGTCSGYGWISARRRR